MAAIPSASTDGAADPWKHDLIKMYETLGDRIFAHVAHHGILLDPHEFDAPYVADHIFDRFVVVRALKTIKTELNKLRLRTTVVTREERTRLTLRYGNLIRVTVRWCSAWGMTFVNLALDDSVPPPAYDRAVYGDFATRF